MPKFHIVNFGCRANQADGALLHAQLAGQGFEASSESATADIIVLNSCTVTAAADYSLRQAARRTHRENPSARILVTGCYAQRRPEELAALPGVECVVGNSHKSEIAKILSQECSCALESAEAQQNTLDQFVPLQALREYPAAGVSQSRLPQIFHSDIFAHTQFLAPAAFGSVLPETEADRTRPNLKIQDGCNNRCSFCIIPSVRGSSRSLPPADILGRIRAFCEAGYREVVLSGINLGRYGRDLDSDQGGRLRFAQLVRSILDDTPLERLRLSSVEPMDFTDELLDLMASSPRIAKHVHAPLQSGSDRILRLMHRKYHPDNYRDRIEAAFARMPNAAFGADVMVGFPGESDEDFEETRALIASLPFTYLHVFPFSRRPGTPADQMPNQVNGAVVRERSRILRELAAEKNLEFRKRQVGRVLEVVTLSETENESTVGLSDNFLDVKLRERLPANQMVRVRIQSITAEGLIGERISD